MLPHGRSVKLLVGGRLQGGAGRGEGLVWDGSMLA